MKIVRLLPCVVVGLLLLSSFSSPVAADEPATPELVDMVVKMFHAEDPSVRGLAFEQVRFYAPGQQATMRFASELSKLSDDAKVGLLRALGDRGDKAARFAITRMAVMGESKPVTVAAVRAIGKLGEPTHAALLVRRLVEGTPAVQKAARRGLIDLSGEGVPQAIAEQLDNVPAADRVTLIYVLSDRRAVDTVPQLLEQSQGEDRSVREAAMVALGWVASPESVSAMVPSVLADRDKQEIAAAEKAIMKVCQKIGNPDDWARPLIAASEKLDEGDRLRLLSTMGRVGGAAALAEIEKAIASDDAKRHEMGLKALSNWPNASIATRYIELVGSEAKPAHQLLALRALIRIAPLRDRRSHEERLELLDKAMSLATRDTERKLVLDRARAVRALGTLQFVAPYMDDATVAEQACLTVVELAHHRGLREPNKAEFHAALDKVIATSQDPVVVDRARRYKADKTWVRPK